jgi:hypothetical protein
MTTLHLLLSVTLGASALTAIDWVMIALYFSVLAGVA